MSAVISLTLGYLLGCLSPARWMSKAKNIDLTRFGTGNLGATNAAYLLGKRAGLRVLALDMAKSFFAFRISRLLFPCRAAAGLFASIGAILGHCFPALHRFKGGKGLAAYAGMVLAYDPVHFLIILVSGCTLMFLLDTGIAATVLGTTLFPILVWLKHQRMDETLAVAAASCLILFTHRDNIRNALANQDKVKTSEFFNKVFPK